MEIISDERDDARIVRWSLTLAILLHVFFFATQWPTLTTAAAPPPADKPVAHVLKLYKFKEPEPVTRHDIKPPPRTVPMPDLTPEDPEPLPRQTVEPTLSVITPGLWDLGVEVPDPPPVIQTVVRVGRDIEPPVRISAPQPRYPEAARMAKIQGRVILDCRIDREGRVAEVQVLRGLPLGLTEAAVEAVEKWRFQPSTFQGHPVEVDYVVSVIFVLQ
jgi:protein TonB